MPRRETALFPQKEHSMSTYGTGLTEGGNELAGADLSALELTAVKAGATARQLVSANAGGEAITGILLNTPTVGQPAIVCYAGYCKARVGAGGWTAGQPLMTEAGTGKLVAKTSTNTTVAIARDTAAAGEFGLCRIIPTAG